MATTLVETETLVSTRFFGGRARGVMVQEHNPQTGETTERPATETEKAL